MKIQLSEYEYIIHFSYRRKDGVTGFKTIEAVHDEKLNSFKRIARIKKELSREYGYEEVQIQQMDLIRRVPFREILFKHLVNKE